MRHVDAGTHVRYNREREESIEQPQQGGRAMYDNHYLTQKIRQYCAARGWYGVDLRGPEWDTEVAEKDPRRTTFTFPPATVDQLQEADTLLGFARAPFVSAPTYRL